MSTVKRFERFGSDAQVAEARVLPDGAFKKRLAIAAGPQTLWISHDTEICLVGIGAHQAAVAATEEMKLHPVIQRFRRTEV